MDDDRCEATLEGEHVWRIDGIERDGKTLVLKKSCCFCFEQRVESQEALYESREEPVEPTEMTFLGAVGAVFDELPVALVFYAGLALGLVFGGDE
jgi:hypothetical protein